jgi:hypothetical protein
MGGRLGFSWAAIGRRGWRELLESSVKGASDLHHSVATLLFIHGLDDFHGAPKTTRGAAALILGKVGLEFERADHRSD